MGSDVKSASVTLTFAGPCIDRVGRPAGAPGAAAGGCCAERAACAAGANSRPRTNPLRFIWVNLEHNFVLRIISQEAGCASSYDGALRARTHHYNGPLQAPALKGRDLLGIHGQ